MEEFIEIIVPLAALVIWVLSQVFGQKANKPDAPPAGNPRPQPGQGGGLRDKIDRFLRKAREQQEEKPPSANAFAHRAELDVG